jgi:hypothetical protein
MKTLYQSMRYVMHYRLYNLLKFYNCCILNYQRRLIATIAFFIFELKLSFLTISFLLILYITKIHKTTVLTEHFFINVNRRRIISIYKIDTCQEFKTYQYRHHQYDYKTQTLTTPVDYFIVLT